MVWRRLKHKFSTNKVVKTIILEIELGSKKINSN